MPLLDHDDRIDHDLQRLIPPDAELVLEAGCGTGSLGAVYKRVNPFGCYVGIERNREAAAVARSRLDRVVVGDVEQLSPTALGIGEETVDCLVYGEVLQQLVNPQQTLRQHAALLKPGGQALACLPNVQHWSLLVELLRGRWRYREEGLLDRNNVRFFTLEGIKELFEQAGLYPYEILPRPIVGQDYAVFQRAMAPVLAALQMDPEQFALQTSAFQYLVRSVKSPQPPRQFSVTTLIGEDQVCARVRVQEPDLFLATIPGVHTYSGVRSVQLEDFKEAEEKVFVFQRVFLHEPQNMAFLQKVLQKGYLVVYEFDDDPERWPEGRKKDWFTFRACHAIQTTTEPLAACLREHNPQVGVFPNQLAFLPPPRQYSADDKVTLFFGALNRETDWQPLIPALQRVLTDHQDHLQVQVVHDQRFFASLWTPHKRFEPFCTYPRYIQLLRGCDLALLPLAPTRTNAMKSDLKFLECAGHGVTALASPIVYENTILQGKTGFLFHSVEEFEARLRKLIVQRELRRTLAANAYEWVGKHRLLAQHYRARLEWYRELRHRLPQLNEELRQRAPELFG
ncbi:MAG TPA: methyltransferase domain-containing protein [Terriglobales bacterium]|nr:methyltransferase domain-containing protein [Terriglobales bacterium]